MNQFITVLEAIVPVFTTILLGAYARKKNILTPEQIRGLQDFVMKFALPCVLFQSCITASFGAEAVTSMALVLPLMFLGTLWAFRFGKRRFPYHNFPMMFAAQESGMLGISLFVALFGSAQAYRMGVLDLTQSFIAIPVIAILSSHTGTSPGVTEIVKKMFRSPLLLMSITGLTLNLTGAFDALTAAGLSGIITETAGFLAQPVSAAILFTVGYNFSLERSGLSTIGKICAVHLGLFCVFCAIIQGVLLLLPSVAAETRWAAALYCALPPSFLSAGLGRSAEEAKIASGVCSILTVATLAIFCVIAAFAA